MSGKTQEKNAKENEKKFFNIAYSFYSYKDSLLLRLRLKLMALLK